jgi:hypothetical protein
MKRNKIVVLMLMVVMTIGGVAGGQFGNQYASLAPDASIVRYDNAKVIQPSDDLIEWYDWLASSDRDGKMGALSADNPRWLILSVGWYELAEEWLVDTSYVYVVSLSGSKYDTVVWRTGTSYGDYTARIKPCYLQLSGFTIASEDGANSGAVVFDGASYSNVCRAKKAVGRTEIEKGVDMLPAEFTDENYNAWHAFVHYQSHAGGEVTAVSATFLENTTESIVWLDEVEVGGALSDVVSFADGGGGTVLVTTDGPHGFEDNYKASIGNSVHYDGSYVVDYVNATSYKITHAWDGDGEATGDILSWDGELGVGERPIVATTDGAHGMLVGDVVIVTDGPLYNGTYTITGVTSDTFTVTASGFVGTEDGTWTRKIGDVWEDCVFGLSWKEHYFYDMCFRTGGSGDGSSSFWGEHFVTGNFYDCDGTAGFATFGIEVDRPGAKTYCRDCIALGFGSFGGDNQYQAVGARWTSGIDWSTYIRCDAGSGAYAGCGGWGSHFGGLIDSCTGGYGCVALLRTMFGTVVNSHFGDKSVAGVPGAAGNVLTAKLTGFIDHVTAGQDSYTMGNNEGTVSGVVTNSRIYNSGLGSKQETWQNVLVGVGLNEKSGALDSGEIGTFSGTFANNHPATPSAAGTTDTITISAFDNGQIYTNEGADGDDTLYVLPPTRSGMEYTICRVDFAAGEDIQIDPDGSEVIYKAKSSGRVVWDPANLIDGAGETSAAITVTGAVLGDIVSVGAPYDMQDLTATGYVQAANTVEIRLQNDSGGAIDLGSGPWEVLVSHKVPVSCGAGKYHGSDADVDAYWEVKLKCFKNGQWLIVEEMGVGESEI